MLGSAMNLLALDNADLQVYLCILALIKQLTRLICL